MSKNVIKLGKIVLGRSIIIGDNVILGHQRRGILMIGDYAVIRSGSIIYSGVKIGKNFRTGHNILIRENTEIGDGVLIGTNSVVENNCRIGSDVSIQTCVYITTNTVLEDGVFMGPCSVTANDKYMQLESELVGPTLKKGARIGANSVLLPGIVVGQNAVVGSGTVVTKNVPPSATVVGNPARELKKSQVR